MDNRSLLSGMAIGAALALAFDPDQGTRRRALIRDIRNRAHGIAAATRSHLRHEEVNDTRLGKRVRAKLGRVCSHPRAIGVYVHDGEVTLIGPVLAEEVRDLLSAAASVRGVHAVVNELEPHESPEGVPSLQGEGRVAGVSFDFLQSNWAPVTLVGAAALAAGGLAIAYSRR